MFDDVLSISMTQDKPGRKQWRSNSGDSGVPKSDGRSQIPASVDTIGMAVLLKLLGQRLQRVTGCQDLMGWCSHSLPVVNVTWIGVIQISKMIQNTIQPASQPAIHPSVRPSIHLPASHEVMGLIPIGYALTGWALFEHDQSLNSGILRTCLDLP